MTTPAPIVLTPREGERLWYDGGLLTLKATGEQSDGGFMLFESLMPRGKATPLHMEQEDETFYLLEGEIRVHIDGVEHVASAGSVVTVPGGTPHAFIVASETARLLVMFTPASAVTEAFFRYAGEPARTATLPPPSPPDPERMMAAAERSGLKVLGPPPFELGEAGAPTKPSTAGTVTATP